ncbi:MAG: transcription-repair coupling factor [Alphaproteobacteria bacterium]|nr:transcription-repair coupling factor [Alphaproteobacteria bacterium]
MTALDDFFARSPRGERLAVAHAPEGHDARVLGGVAIHNGRMLIHVCRDDGRMARMRAALGFFWPELEVRSFPAWDCLPYDRVSPNPEIVSRRIATLAELTRGATGPRIVLTTVNAAIQRVPPRRLFAERMLVLERGMDLPLDRLKTFLERNGYNRAETVREAGEYAVRGGLIDLYPSGAPAPLRLDFFGDRLEAIRSFDPLSQRSAGAVERADLKPMSEVLLDAPVIERFRSRYRQEFGAGVQDDPLYESVSAGRRHAGMEHFLPLFYESLDTLFDYLPGADVVLDHQAEEARGERIIAIADFHDARANAPVARGALGTAPFYRPLKPELLYLGDADWTRALADRRVVQLSPFAAPESAAAFDAGARPGPEFTAARADPNINLFDAVRAQLEAEAAAGRRVLIVAYSTGSAERLKTVMKDHGISEPGFVEFWQGFVDLPGNRAGLAVLPLERGFVADSATLITEQDILGDRLARPARRRTNLDHFVAEVATLTVGDLVVHAEHGIGRYDGLVTLEVAGAPHDCLRLIYAGDDKLFVPVENIEVLSRYGSEDAAAQLDRLGGVAWQSRKARVKARIRDIAGELIRLAAERQLKEGEPMASPEGLYEEFAARFPYPETDDQDKAIHDTLGDLGSGRPTDRLICGDVGFGKTEVALRAAFIAVMAGTQVAVVVPTTLLARQHYRTFVNRFAGMPVKIEQLSRFVPAKRAEQIKRDLNDGKIDIVIGTHSLLGKGVGFRHLGLLVIDEEQHFGVAQKERLKKLKANVHVVTLTATPIPRTLQMALAGVREMSIIATPPMDRLAVRTFVMAWDPVVIREAILRELHRGGQVFCVVPRIADIADVEQELKQLVPEARLAVAHGQLAPTQLDKVMTAFDDGAFDVLLCTDIVESGLDIPTANTLVVHRADMFGLAQLYQLRGRIGRGKIRAYAYLTLPPGKVLSSTAERRLEVMQTLDQLGAGFTLASHDLDIRGAGNLLGEEQSGHIREVGVELYQHLLEEAIVTARTGGAAEAATDWTPQIAVGTSVLIPETYVADLNVRLGLYRRIASLVDRQEIESFAAELIDRFGKLPPEVENLLEIIAIKRLCREAGIEKIEAGPKGAAITFHAGSVADPAALVQWIASQAGSARLRPDQRLIVVRDWDDTRTRIKGVINILEKLKVIAAGRQPVTAR